MLITLFDLRDYNKTSLMLKSNQNLISLYVIFDFIVKKKNIYIIKIPQKFIYFKIS